jgi:transposase
LTLRTKKSSTIAIGTDTKIVMVVSTTETSPDALVARVAQLEAQLSAERAASQALVAKLQKDVDTLSASHDRLRQELEMLRRRIFVAKAERIDSKQLELEFATKLATLDELAHQIPARPTVPDLSSTDSDGRDSKAKPRPKGRRDLRGLKIPEVRIEITDPVFDALVAEGKAVRVDFEESCKLAWQRGGQRRLVIARATYRTTDDDPMFETAPVPEEILPRALAAPSMLAHIVHEKFGRGMPQYRIESGFRRDGVPIDRGTMSRWLEELGGVVGATIIEAARLEALATAFCISTDATGIAIQPERGPEKQRQACRRGHYFVQIADRDHVFFEYTPQENSKAVAAMFRDFKGYVQADAKSVFNVLFRPPPSETDDPDEVDVAIEIGCYSHARRKFWEAAIATKSAAAREGVYRIGRLYELEASWRHKPPDEITRLRHEFSRPQVEAFFAWAQSEYEQVRGQRGLLRTAFGYAVRQKDALTRFLDDGRLSLDNNASERELRQIAVGRKAWLFVGSDDHAASAGNLMSMIASARLHNLDAEDYLRDIFRVLPHWPKDRYLELAPKYWAATRVRLDARELAAEVGVLTIPAPLPPPAEQHATD